MSESLNNLKILYCRVGWMKFYVGAQGDHPKNGGSFNKKHCGYEIYNFREFDSKYYGYVEPGKIKDRVRSINIDKLGAPSSAEKIDGVLVVWFATKEKSGQYVVGWYKNATVFKKRQDVPDNVREKRDPNQNAFYYNVLSTEKTSIQVEKRDQQIKGAGQSNIWYGNKETNQKVLDFIYSYDKQNDETIANSEKNTENLTGKDKKALINSRVNQNVFRERLNNRYSHCCLCGVSNEHFLVASHIKPWQKSNGQEKLDVDNGLLLCANHDKLFDQGYITFSDTGKIIISKHLDNENRKFMNVHPEMRIELKGDNMKYLKYHRKNIFIDQIKS